MKKVLLFIITMLFAIPVANATVITKPQVTNHEKVTIYLFWASWCPHCHDFLEYFSDKYDEYRDYFEIVTYQLDTDYEINNLENNNLLDAVRKEVGYDGSGIPFIIVGNWYQVGFGSDGSNIIEEALKAYQSSKYTDVVKKVINSENSIGFDNTFENTIDMINGNETETDDAIETIGPTYSSNSLLDIIINFIRNILLNLLNII